METADQFEQKHVQNVYEDIAQGFSSTRFKIWPVVQQFIDECCEKSAEYATLIGDIGCGNGKNMHCLLNYKNVKFIGLDSSLGLLTCAQTKGQRTNLIQSNILNMPLRRHSLNHAMCIAVLHHLSTETRRIEALRQIVQSVQYGGQILIFVWAVEQGVSSKRQQMSMNGEQDVMVPFKSKIDGGGRLVERYYHLFKESEMERLIDAACDAEGVQCVPARRGYDRDNWYVQFSCHKIQ